MSRVRNFLVSFAVLLAGRGHPDRRRGPDRIVGPAPRNPGSELVVAGLLVLTALSALAFPIVYALDRIPHQNQFLGVSLGLAFLFLALALALAGTRLLPEEELEEDYPLSNPPEQAAVAEILEESASGISRKGLLAFAGGLAAAALGVALVTPAVSMGPVADPSTLRRTPWTRGRRLVDDNGEPIAADDIEEGVFYTAYPEGSDRALIGAPVVLVRLNPDELALPAGREGWAPDGVLAYSKICTHAACAISLYRSPKFAPTQPKPALVCPCHYSTFDPARGAAVIFGPAGRPLPQLPLAVDADGNLRAAGDFSGPVGPSWWGVRMGEAT